LIVEDVPVNARAYCTIVPAPVIAFVLLLEIVQSEIFNVLATDIAEAVPDAKNTFVIAEFPDPPTVKHVVLIVEFAITNAVPFTAAVPELVIPFVKRHAKISTVPADIVFAVKDEPEFVKYEFLRFIFPALEEAKIAIPVVPKSPVQLIILTLALALDVVNDIPVLFVQFKLQLFKFTTEANVPVTAKKKSEFV
jgi:hypothetical protein